MECCVRDHLKQKTRKHIQCTTTTTLNRIKSDQKFQLRDNVKITSKSTRKPSNYVKISCSRPKLALNLRNSNIYAYDIFCHLCRPPGDARPDQTVRYDIAWSTCRHCWRRVGNGTAVFGWNTTSVDHSRSFSKALGNSLRCTSDPSWTFHDPQLIHPYLHQAI